MGTRELIIFCADIGDDVIERVVMIVTFTFLSFMVSV